MEMKMKVSKTIDRILNAANDVVSDCLIEAIVIMNNNQRVESDEDGNIITYQQGDYSKVLNRLYQLRDEVFNSKVGFNLKINLLDEEKFSEQVKIVLNEVTDKHLEFIKEANELILNIK